MVNKKDFVTIITTISWIITIFIGINLFMLLFTPVTEGIVSVFVRIFTLSIIGIISVISVIVSLILTLIYKKIK